ncbi:MAG: hypothetical protein OEW83_00525 [Acidimicrobiia bacterium]|nr:hypothetical protein [Acidimicrobiia bacterium]
MAAKKAKMTEEHKQALAVGRAEGRMVRAYLEALESSRPKRGRKRTKESIGRRLERIEVELEEADPLKRLQLTQEQIDLTEELDGMDNGVNITDLENDFVRVAEGYAERKGITYQAFRQIGVPASVLKRAGISRAA